MRTVRCAYAIDTLFGTVQRVLVDEAYNQERPMIFYPGNSWMIGPREGERLVFLPGRFEMKDWFNGWWEDNWRSCPDWVWCYGMAPRGMVNQHYIRVQEAA